MQNNETGAFRALANDVGASAEEPQRQPTVETSMSEIPAVAPDRDYIPVPARQCHVAFRLPPYHLVARDWNHTVRDNPAKPERATSGSLTLTTRSQSSTVSFAAADLPDELPPGWEWVISDDEEYYVNHNCSTRTWTDPRSQKLPARWKIVEKDGDIRFFDKETKVMSETDPRPNPLPHGWTMRQRDTDGSIYYFNHLDQISSWKDPRDGLCPSTGEAVPLEWVPRKVPSTGRVYLFARNTWTTTPNMKPYLSQDWPLKFMENLLTPSARLSNLDLVNPRDMIENLPIGCEVMANVYDGRPFFVDHKSQTCSFIDPRSALIPSQSQDHWKLRRTTRDPEVFPERNPAEELVFSDPMFNISLAEQAMQSLEMRHARSPHTCLHCSNIMFDFRNHPSRQTEVWCAKSMRDVFEAKRGGCPFFVHLFNDSVAPEDIIMRNSGVYLSIERYTEGQTLFGKMKMFDDHDEREKIGEIEPKKRHYYITQPNGIKGEKYGRVSSQKPALRLCGDPNSRGTSLTSMLDGPLHAPDVYSWGSLAWAKELLDNCEQEHKRCNKVRRLNSQFAPTRLVDVRFHRDVVRVVDSRGVNPQWCCLSYVWGEGHRQVKTTKETLAAHMDYIPIAFLPPTIRDAIIVARWLKIRYIWIDSLCIIQDKPDDVLKELRLMPDIYRLALVTIIAASATGVGDGFLHYRGYFYPDGSPPPTKLHCLDQWGKETSILAFEELKGPQAAVDYGTPIERRGWTFQERRISHRTLYYGPRGLTFFCPTAQVRDRNLFHHHVTSFMEREARLVDQPTFERHFTEKTAKDWCSIVQDYSGRKLGMEGDKLTAIAAIAAVHDSWGSWGKYMAGLWNFDLPEGLDWYVEPAAAGMNLHPRPRTYRAPTWSWASVEGKVAFWTRVRIKYRNVVGWTSIDFNGDEIGARYPLGIRWWTKSVKASVQPVSPDLPFGPVKSASMVIKGDMTAVYWMEDESGKCEVVSHSGHQFLAYPDTTENIVDADHNEEEGPQLRLLGIARIGSILPQRCGMVLQRIAGGRYKRVGFFFCCSAVNWHESKGLAQACEDKFMDFKTDTVTII